MMATSRRAVITDGIAAQVCDAAVKSLVGFGADSEPVTRPQWLFKVAAPPVWPENWRDSGRKLNPMQSKPDLTCWETIALCINGFTSDNMTQKRGVDRQHVVDLNAAFPHHHSSACFRHNLLAIRSQHGGLIDEGWSHRHQTLF
jgi:hypothetical protein